VRRFVKGHSPRVACQRRNQMAYRVVEWVDDESRSYGGSIHTAFDVLPDGSEQEGLETRL
jgi:hypothetical protein